jgi:NADP-dependent 3-hydroxy acid dehydrogenase YdfG
VEEIEAARRGVAVVTGAASGIGRALAQEAARRGMSVALGDIDMDGLAQTEALLHAAGVETLSSVVDVRRRADLKAFADRVQATLGPPRLVFANAGVLRTGPIWTLAEADADLVIDVNLKGALNTASVFLPRLMQQSSPCRLIFTASVGALTAAPNLAVYSATKHAVWAIAESTLRDLRAAGSPVEVSLLCPGAVATALADHAAAGPVEQSLRGRMAEVGLAPAEVARRAFEAIDAGRFWIFPQESYLPAIRRRLERVLKLAPPTSRGN